MAFKEALKWARLRAGLSQEELAHRAGVARTTINYLERGTRKPSLEVFVLLADALKIDPVVLLRKAIKK
jgi:transcriptional regulator with XRE-family HTH domain